MYEDATGKSFTRYSYVSDAIVSGSKSEFTTAISGMIADYDMKRDDINAESEQILLKLVKRGQDDRRNLVSPARTATWRGIHGR